ncbi:MAG: barstar family protein [Propionibacteriaceae bacterium]|nr:barstar family protein [Propionibacteriaceae bacterium]
MSVTIDGTRIHDISSFYAELNRVFMQGVEWQLGESLDALNDLLHGGYGALADADEATVVWIDMERNREALGVDATRAWLEAKLGNPGFDQQGVRAQLAELEEGGGPTYFDIILDIFASHPNITLVAAGVPEETS